MKIKKEHIGRILMLVLVIAILAMIFVRFQEYQNKTAYTSSAYLMSTITTQKVYGTSARDIMKQTETFLLEFEQEQSLYVESSDINKINAAAGQGAVEVSQRTYDLLQKAKELSASSEGTFTVTIAPISMAWGITQKDPHVLSQEEIDTLLPLVNDENLVLENGTAQLQQENQAIDLGGIAKGAACDLVREFYIENKVNSALIDLGGSTIYAHGRKPDGTLFRIGFRNPSLDAQSSIVSFTIENQVFATSGGYERYFEEDGVRYQHIFDPKTGKPAESDIISIGVLKENGIEADFYSTMLFVAGKEKALEYMRNGGAVVFLDNENQLYVSQVFADSLEVVDSSFTVNYI